jgi:energy-coupling factor transporter ATP-binding protein EcfA2
MEPPSPTTRLTSIHFKNYKAFSSYTVHFGDFDVLVGPNNSGKSTILGALRILSEGLRKARSRNPDFVTGPIDKVRGYAIDLRGLPVSTENVFHNYNDEEPASVKFRLSNGNELILFFPEQGVCNLIPNANRPVRSTVNFNSQFDFRVAFVPVLGPVDHNEPLYQREAARLALLSHGASRNFRNIWYHFTEGFTDFRAKVKASWPGMDIQPPEVIYGGEKPLLCMLCPEDRFPRELFWSGFGFQVWCQMLTFILRARDASLLVIDEPDIYLHSDLQRQLVSILRDLGPAIVIATHSTEIISEVDADAILNINKRFRTARRIKNTQELVNVFSVLGSNLNPTLTQLAKTKRVVFVEGKDFQMLAGFARRMGLDAVANRSHFAVIPVQGFNPQKVKDFSSGMELTLGSKLMKFVLFDRDYRPTAEANHIAMQLGKFCWHAIVHDRKEIENFLLQPEPLARAINDRIASAEGGLQLFDGLAVQQLLMQLSEPLKNRVQAQLVAASQQFERQQQTGLHTSNISEAVMNDFDTNWQTFETRMKIVPGKELLSLFNQQLQSQYSCALTTGAIIRCFKAGDIPAELASILNKLEELRSKTPESDDEAE